MMGDGCLMMDDGCLTWVFFNDINMSFKFEKLIIWQKAMDFGEEINEIAANFPKNELYNLSSQILRAVDSVALNISEGAIEQSTAEFKRFLNYAIRSIAEVVTCLHKAKRRSYITNEKFDFLYAKCFELMNMTLAFKAQLK
jgi:four helix bundle protein